MLTKLFRWLFHDALALLDSRIENLQRREVALDDQVAAATRAVGQIDTVLQSATFLCDETRATADKIEDLRGQISQLFTSVNSTSLSQLSGFAARFDKLNADTSKALTVILTEIESHVADIKTTFAEQIDARAKAEVAKWVFVGGGGGALAAVQYCALCAQPASKWRMVPDEGPICEVCCQREFDAYAKTS